MVEIYPSLSTILIAIGIFVVLLIIGLWAAFGKYGEPKIGAAFVVFGIAASVLFLFFGYIDDLKRYERLEDYVVTSQKEYRITGYSTSNYSVHVTYDKEGELITDSVPIGKAIFNNEGDSIVYIDVYSHKEKENLPNEYRIGKVILNNLENHRKEE